VPGKRVPPRHETAIVFFWAMVIRAGHSMRFSFVASTFVFMLASASSAVAADWYTGAPSTSGTSRGGSSSGLNSFGAAVDLALTATSNDTLHLALIGTISPFTRMDESGLRLRLGGVTGSYSYIASTAGLGRIRGTQEQGSFMVGYEWVSRTTTVAGFVGGEVRNDKLTPADPTNSVAGTAYGVRGELDFYSKPTSWSLVAGQFVYSSAHSSYYGRMKFGMSVFENIYVGPEVMLLGDSFYSQWRVGGHLTGISFGPMQFGVSAGYSNDRVRGSGVYGILDARVGF
jgi:hypothetical protein